MVVHTCNPSTLHRLSKKKKGNSLDWLTYSESGRPTMVICKLEGPGNQKLLSARSWKPQNKEINDVPPI
jgi:hypothetical protein